MGQIQRLTRGRVKPYHSVPRIDWSHPLAAGLVAYCYDIGGAVIDLVNGGFLTPVGALGSQESQFGRGLEFPTTGYGFMPPLPTSKASQYGGSAPFSLSLGTFCVGDSVNAEAVIVSVQDAGNSTDTECGFNSMDPTTVAGIYGNSTTVSFGQRLIHNSFQTWGFSATSSSAGSQYGNGVFDTSVATTTIFSLTNPEIMYSTAASNAPSFSGGINGFVPYFAIWGSRALTAADHLQLYQDPYSLLIYPEDEMYDLVGIAGPADILMSQIWI